MQLTTALEGFWLSKARSLSQNTVNDYNHSYGRFVRFLADRHLEEIETVTPSISMPSSPGSTPACERAMRPTH